MLPGGPNRLSGTQALLVSSQVSGFDRVQRLLQARARDIIHAALLDVGFTIGTVQVEVDAVGDVPGHARLEVEHDGVLFVDPRADLDRAAIDIAERNGRSGFAGGAERDSVHGAQLVADASRQERVIAGNRQRFGEHARGSDDAGGVVLRKDPAGIDGDVVGDVIVRLAEQVIPLERHLVDVERVEVEQRVLRDQRITRRRDLNIRRDRIELARSDSQQRILSYCELERCRSGGRRSRRRKRRLSS